MEGKGGYINCKWCGGLNASGANFCSFCGQRLEYPITEATSKVEEEKYSSAENVDTDQSEGKKKKWSKFLSSITDKKLRIGGNIIMTIVCLLLFILSFCSITSIECKIEDMGTFNVNISSIDYIWFMGATTKDYDNEDLEDSRESEALAETGEKLAEALEDDYNERRDKYDLSDDTKSLMGQYAKALMVYSLCSEEINGSATEINIILMGVFSLLSIIFSALLLLFSILSLVCSITGRKNPFVKTAFFIPAYFAYLFILVLLSMKESFASAELNINTASAGGIVAAMVFAGIFFVGTLVAGCIKNGKSAWKKAIPQFLSAVMGKAVLSSMFAPFYSVNLKTVTKGSDRKTSYNLSYGADFVSGTFCGKSEQENLENLQDMTHYEKRSWLNEKLNDLSTYTKNEIRKGYADEDVEYLVIMTMLIDDDYNIARFLSMGYYFMIFIPIAIGVIFSCNAASVFGKNKKAAIVSMRILTLTFSLIALAVAVISRVIIGIQIQDYGLKGLSLSLGEGGILLAVFSLVSVIIIPIISKAVTVRKTKYSDDNFIKPSFR